MSDEMFEKRLKQQFEEDKLINLRDRKKEQFITNEDGGIKHLFANLVTMLRKSEKVKGIQFNEFTQVIAIDDVPITDAFLSELKYDISKRYYMDFSDGNILQALQRLASENSFHPVKNMIESKQWDGVERAETLFIDYLGADDNEYIRKVTRRWLAGAVARIYNPGVKFEIVPILSGDQGIGKSTIGRKIGGEYFTDSLKSLGKSKDDYQLLIGKWIIELAELSSMNKTQIEEVKNFISAETDSIRLPYDKITQNYDRTAVFIGTTNHKQYLKDATGNRRFFPIYLESTPKKNIHEISDEIIQQIWAEAYELYTKGEQIYFTEGEQKTADKYRSEAVEENILLHQVDEYLEMPVPKNWNSKSDLDRRIYYDHYREGDSHKVDDGDSVIDRVTVKELAYVMKIEPQHATSASRQKMIRLHMDNLPGWQYKSSIKVRGKTTSGYIRK
ncbi:virulence-associated E family protein [Salinicoccus sp. Marseille-QA3877]